MDSQCRELKTRDKCAPSCYQKGETIWEQKEEALLMICFIFSWAKSWYFKKVSIIYKGMIVNSLIIDHLFFPELLLKTLLLADGYFLRSCWDWGWGLGLGLFLVDWLLEGNFGADRGLLGRLPFFLFFGVEFCWTLSCFLRGTLWEVFRWGSLLLALFKSFFYLFSGFFDGTLLFFFLLDESGCSTLKLLANCLTFFINLLLLTDNISTFSAV